MKFIRFTASVARRQTVGLGIERSQVRKCFVQNAARVLTWIRQGYKPSLLVSATESLEQNWLMIIAITLAVLTAILFASFVFLLILYIVKRKPCGGDSDTGSASGGDCCSKWKDKLCGGVCMTLIASIVCAVLEGIICAVSEVC